MNNILTENITNKVMSIIKEKLNGIINESLVQSYPPQNVIDIIRRKFNLTENDVFLHNVSTDMGPSYIIVVLLPATTDRQTIIDIKHFMRWSGYFLESNELNKVGDKLAYCFEPKFGYDISDYICEEFEYLYHVTPTKYLGRIKKYGLVPGNKNTHFNYPDRIYLMAGNSLSSFQRQILWFVTNNIKQDDKNPRDNNTFSLLTIDTEMLPDNVRLYTDSTSQGAVFTHDNIPPSAITRIEEFRI